MQVRGQQASQAHPRPDWLHGSVMITSTLAVISLQHRVSASVQSAQARSVRQAAGTLRMQAFRRPCAQQFPHSSCLIFVVHHQSLAAQHAVQQGAAAAGTSVAHLDWPSNKVQSDQAASAVLSSCHRSPAVAVHIRLRPILKGLKQETVASIWPMPACSSQNTAILADLHD